MLKGRVELATRGFLAQNKIDIKFKADFFGFLAPLAECYKYIEGKLSVDNVIQLWLGIITFNIALSIS
jgi:hypothetical protein